MPQMAPMNWLFLYFMFTVIFLIFNFFNYYIYLIKNDSFSKNKNLLIKIMTWKW
uniref:ATP synthase complex subunit 8 n=2 Tax=Diplocheila TaxID=177375 RepID=A0A6M5A4G4_9CARA|nr:ATP synthase F0 subunit 8 [Diplocheila zeelandica]QJT42739.1 ATP synthase F0 subunit 8 [Diplocheila zealandica]UXF64374.1 ATP synthase F0 subunit 8 [Diplocheila zeelandica]